MINPLHELLPDEISDEGAYKLVTFFMELTAALESHYFGQMKRHIKEKMPPQLPAYLTEKSAKESDF